VIDVGRFVPAIATAQFDRLRLGFYFVRGINRVGDVLVVRQRKELIAIVVVAKERLVRFEHAA